MIVYATTEGHTRDIAEFLRDEAEKEGLVAALFDATVTPPDPDEYDSVIIASSMHAGKYQLSIQDYVRANHNTLNNMKSLFMSVSLAAAADEPESWQELKEQTSQFLIETGWKPDIIEYVAGALLYTRYDFFKRFTMRLIQKRSGGDIDTSTDHVYTDWDQVRGVLPKIKALN